MNLKDQEFPEFTDVACNYNSSLPHQDQWSGQRFIVCMLGSCGWTLSSRSIGFSEINICEWLNLTSTQRTPQPRAVHAESIAYCARDQTDLPNSFLNTIRQFACLLPFASYSVERSLTLERSLTTVHAWLWMQRSLKASRSRNGWIGVIWPIRETIRRLFDRWICLTDVEFQISQHRTSV